MLVIHPYDPSTEFLDVLYDGQEGVRRIRGEESRNRLGSILYHLPPVEPVMLLGHGSPSGLFRLEDGGNGLYVGKSFAYSLRKHPVIGVFCHANRFAENTRLHGLFSGMIVSEPEEALEYRIPATAGELERENRIFAETLAGFLRAGIPYREIPLLMKAAVGDDAPEVRKFNYNSFYFL